MKPGRRKEWILNYMRRDPSRHVDVLDAEFVVAYIDATGARSAAQPFGAAKCPQLGRDLRWLYATGFLERYACGLSPGDASMGFPKWVWTYNLRHKHSMPENQEAQR